MAHADEAQVHYATRGEVLYLTQCINCHRASEHWKDQNAVTDWKSLGTEIGRWQVKLNLGWSLQDINDVARYLNDAHYKFSRTD